MPSIIGKKKGSSRVVLGRELNLDEIEELVKSTRQQIEVFIHGGMCASYSGRCTLSNTFTLRDANRGGCAHSCRWNYELFDQETKLSNDTLFSMSSKDLQAINQIPKLIDIGVHSLKIEGRMKSIHYIATVVWVYRRLIDEYLKTGQVKDFNHYIDEINKAENRMTAQGFLEGMPKKETQLYNQRSERPNQIFIGIVETIKDDYIQVEQRNHFKPGDTIEVFGPNLEPTTFVLDKIYDEEMNELDAARHPKQKIRMKIPFKTSPNDLLRKHDEIPT